jgi:concanavalin A-like lectin/glucanase superfamily protein
VPQPVRHSLTGPPSGAALRSVTAVPAQVDGRAGLRVQLTDEVAHEGTPGVDYVDQPTFVMIPAEFRTGTIEVDVRAGLTPTAPDYARGFAGIAYHLLDGGDRFEAVYLRPLNGASLDPPAPRQLRAVQYFAYPDWPFSRLRETYPEGVYEAGADITPDRWIHLAVTVDESTVTVSVDGVEVLTVREPKSAPVSGAIGLFVDIGTRAEFADLVVEPSS